MLCYNITPTYWAGVTFGIPRGVHLIVSVNCSIQFPIFYVQVFHWRQKISKHFVSRTNTTYFQYKIFFFFFFIWLYTKGAFKKELSVKKNQGEDSNSLDWTTKRNVQKIKSRAPLVFSCSMNSLINLERKKVCSFNFFVYIFSITPCVSNSKHFYASSN